MFRITRGHQVQHIHFPVPIIRDLDALDEHATRDEAADAAPSPATRDEPVQADASAGAPQ